ncbi:MAG: DNA methyltransferase, partial [Egibacteraceae bacterium]
LAPTGTLWLHCDPTASHYLKIILDAVFGTGRFLNEVIWQRTSAHNRTTRFGPVHDVILAYTKSEAWTWNPQYVPYDEEYVESFYRHVEGDTGRRYRLSDLTSNRPGSRQPFQGQLPPGTRYWGYAIETMERFASEDRIVYTSNNYPQYKRYLDEMPGKLLQDLWTDIPPLSTRSAERLGYPTQKPEALLERIIIAGSNEGDLVLDPFAGCGTAIAVAQRLRRRWIGVDVAFLAVDLMDKRLRARYDEAELAGTYDIHGIPRDLGGAQALFEYSPFEFEKWAVSRVQGQPHERQTGDRGVDGTIRFPLRDTNQRGRVLVSVKGGERLTPSMVRDLIGTVDNHRAEMGLMITLAEPTPGMVETAKQAGSYVWDLTGRRFDRVQIVTVAQLLSGQTLQLPAAFLPYVKAKRTSMAQQGTLGI